MAAARRAASMRGMSEKTVTVAQCMGGWCSKRQHCQHYHAPSVPGRAPEERLCDPGHDGEVARLIVIRPVGTWERSSWTGILAAPSPLPQA